mmetsp:Transcript_39709/g.104861  ORF Transcript_39709/g.104861 Transcript_39709/m.104861 type:complete len:545 (-) Transcript_39709:158-1792(-)|eukprot:CAMPEP_0115860418 /NCGR_PEP_ID=MMETSP0287-20121206/17119_1 /TAXON_ID=412157 /ORGANISM="Chrysochromulina rotalis, Strain UIO044" /LENGTH=544 /DNA_ID=CAMNT_0003314745 /DNA_START=23 /DNA_END=1657 /DNA_ORIENTATION=-
MVLHGSTHGGSLGGLGGGVAVITGAVEAAITPTEVKETARLWTYVLELSALVLTFLIGRALDRREIHYLPHSGVGVLIGAINAGLLQLLASTTSTHIDNDIARDERFDADFFMVCLLPPIIFDAGFNMDAPSAWRNIGPTLFLAVIGTIFSTFVVGLLLHGAGALGLCYPLGMLASLTFGSLISATDPVSVLSVFQAIGVHDDVFAIVFGESVLNDAVAIVLTRTLLSFKSGSAQPALLRIGLAAFIFVFDFVSSLAIGAAFGLALSYTLRKLDVRSSARQDDLILVIALCFAFPWASYYVAEALQLSGIVTLLFCGMVMARFARPHMSEDATQATRSVFKAAAVIAETGVFIYLGEAVFTFPILHNTVWRLVLVALLACAIGRMHVVAGVRLTNLYRRGQLGRFGGSKRRTARVLSTTEAPLLPEGVELVLWWSGLRGGVAFALAASSFSYGDFEQHCGGAARSGHGHHAPSASTIECHNSEGKTMTDGLAILQTTLIVATLSIFVLGGSVKNVAECARVLKHEAPSATNAAMSVELGRSGSL